MTARTVLRRFAAERRAITAVEFGLVGSMMMLMTFGTIDLGVLLWTQTALQSVAATAARCAAISSALCTDVPTYAVTLANGWTMHGMISTSNVTVTAVTTCNGYTGSFEQVLISAPFWQTILPGPFQPTLTAKACYPH